MKLKITYLSIVVICFVLVACSQGTPQKKEKIKTQNALIQQVEQVKTECENEVLHSITYTECLEKLAVVKGYTVKLILDGKVSKEDYSIVIASVDSALVELEIIKKSIQHKINEKALQDNVLLIPNESR